MKKCNRRLHEVLTSVQNLAALLRESGNEKPEVSIEPCDYELILRAFPNARSNDLGKDMTLYGVKIKRL